MRVVLLLFFIFGCLVGTSFSQQLSYCSPMTNIPKRCQEVLPYRSWMVPLQFNVTAQELIKNATDQLAQADIPLVPPNCRANLVKLICLASFRECTPVSTYVTPTVLQGLKVQVESNMQALVPYAGVSQSFGILTNSFGGLVPNFFNQAGLLLPNPILVGQQVQGVSTFLGYSLDLSPLAIDLILKGNGSAYGQPTGFVKDVSGRSVLAMILGFQNATNNETFASQYNCTASQIAGLINYLVNYNIPQVVLPGVNATYGSLPLAAAANFVQQWANGTLAPQGLDPAIPGFELGFGIVNGVPSVNVTGLSVQSSQQLWDKTNVNSFANATGFGRWLRALRAYQWFSVVDSSLAQVFGITNDQVVLIFNWLARNDKTLFPGLLQIQLSPPEFAVLNVSVVSTFACNSVCQDVQSTCTQFASENNVALPDCAAPNLFIVPPVPDFPVVGNTLALNNASSIFVSCEVGSLISVDTTVTESDINCQEARLVFVKDAYPPCAEPCIVDPWEGNRREAAITTGLVISIISCVATVLLIINLCLRKFFTFPRNLPLFLAIASNLLSVGFIIALGGQDKVLCHSPSKRVLADGGACIFQAVLIHYFALCVTMWWLMIATNLFLSVVMKMKNVQKTRMAITFYLLGWGLPMIPVIIALAAGAYGFDGKSPWCFVTETSWELGLFYVPVLIITFIGIIIIFWIVVKVIQSTLASKGYVSSGKRAKLPRETYRLLFFLFILLYVYAFVYSFRFMLISDEDEINVSIQDWAVCVLKNQFSASKSICEIRKNVSYGVFFVFILNATLQGILAFVFFGLTKENGRWVYLLLTEGRFAAEKSLRSGTGGDTSGQGTDRSKGNSVEDVEMKQGGGTNTSENTN